MAPFSHNLTYGSCFSGAGGIDLGFDRAGWACKWLIEWNAYAQTVLRRTWPDVPVYGDIQQVASSDLVHVDCIVGGVPCTDASLCAFGSKKGLDGPATGLVREFGRLVQDLQPRFFLMENAPKMLSLWPGVMAMGYFDGYTVEGEILEASRFGAYTRRKRAFFVGHLGTLGGRKVFDFGKVPVPTFRTGGEQDRLPICLPWKGGVSLERLGACVLEPVFGEVANTEADASRTRKSDGHA